MNAATARQIRGVRRSVEDLMIHRDSIIEKPKSGGSSFSGTAYVAGHMTTGLNSDSAKPWVRCFLSTGTAEEHAGPPPNPWPPNESWREKDFTSGHIVIDRA